MKLAQSFTQLVMVGFSGLDTAQQGTVLMYLAENWTALSQSQVRVIIRDFSFVLLTYTNCSLS